MHINEIIIFILILINIYKLNNINLNYKLKVNLFNIKIREYIKCLINKQKL